MAIYLIYLVLIFIVPSICSLSQKDKKKSQETALRILMFLMYLMLALKAETVGSDIRGYGELYEYSKNVSFGDFTYCYMENGYILLMQIFTKLGLSFQAFEAILYAIFIIPLYYLIKNYSSNVMLSVLILFCTDCFVFACSGLRQTVAMSICVCAFMVVASPSAKKEKRVKHRIKYLILSILIVVAASFIHRSALLFIPVLMIVYFQYKFLTYVVFVLVSLLLLTTRHFFLNLNQQYELSHYEFHEEYTLGLMFVFQVLMFVFYLFSIKQNKYYFDNELTWQYGVVIFYGLLLQFAFSGSILMRSAAYELLFLSIIMPNAIQSWKGITRVAVTVVYAATLIYLFYFMRLDANALRIVPYRFFFQ